MTPVEVAFVSALLFSLALNGILGSIAIRLLGDLVETRQELWQLHLERFLTIFPPESEGVVKQPRTGTRMSGLRSEGNVVFLNNAEQSVV